ncbi:ENTH-domain-containing protein [Marasmius fiardii PR-910]|nr:ENTH-domain-containing protein [Marasmius fiardii PR-910]
MHNFGKAALRVTKNYTKGYSDTQAKVRDATSNDPWGPSGTQMNEIAQLTYNQGDFVEIMEMLDKRLNDKGKNWRHVFKSLTVLDYCLHQGSENVVIYFRDNIYIIKTLKEFQYVDENGKDQGANVRQKAKDITNLLLDESRLRQERRNRAHMRDRMLKGTATVDGDNDEYYNTVEEDQARMGGPSGGTSGGRNTDEDDLRKAIEESKRTLAQEQIKAEERELQQAIKLSEEEEAKRNKAVEESNASALFDEQHQMHSSTNPFPMTTLSDPTPYTVGLQPQFTQIQPQFTQLQPQFTSFNPYHQQMQQEAAQAEFLRQQQAFQQQQAAAQAQQQQEEWMRQQQLLQQQQLQQQQLQHTFAQSLAPQPTGFGSNNPFAPKTVSSPVSPMNDSKPSFDIRGTYDQHNWLNDLSSPSSYTNPSSTPSGSTQSQGNRPVAVKTNPNENKELANLFAEREGGQDTFGNVGILRYGHTDAGRMVAQQSTKTGNLGHNPFARQQQSSEQPFFSI